jgi:hypothetical protein
MRARTPALVAAVAAVAAIVWWRRHSSARTEPLVQLGLSDGSVRTLDRTDPSTIELQALAAGVRDSFTGGA